jgi:WD40 repeat protein
MIVAAWLFAFTLLTLLEGTHANARSFPPRLMHFRTNVAAWHFAFSPDSRLLAAYTFPDRKLVVWNITTSKAYKTLDMPQNALIDSVSFTHDGKGLITNAYGKPTLEVWDLDSGQLRKVLRGHKSEIRVVTTSAKGNLLASGDGWGIVKVWDLTSLTEKASVQPKKHNAYVSSVAISFDEKMLAVGYCNKKGSRGELQLWDLAKLNLYRTFDNYPDPVGYIAFTRDGKTIASGAWRAPTLLRETSSGRLLTRWESEPYDIFKAEFSPAGMLVTTAISRDEDPESGVRPGALRFWDQSGNEVLKSIRSPIGYQSIRFSSDGKYLAALIYENEEKAVVLFDASGLQLSTQERDQGQRKK